MPKARVHRPRLPVGRMPRRRFGRGLGSVQVGAAANLIGALLKYLSAAFLLPLAIAVGYGEPIWPFLIGGAVTFLFGAGLELATRGKEQVGPREGFLVVAATWLLGAGFVSIPYLLSGDPQLSAPIDAYFEAMSGMTTTGASVLTDIPALNQSTAMWRQFSQWIGGMGIIVLAIAILPRLRVGGRPLFASEAPGNEFQSLTRTIRETARVLWILYVALTAIEIAVLATLGWTGVDAQMNLFEAVAHAFTTMPTGGFSTRGRSIEEFETATEWTIIAFMLLAGTNFVLMHAAVRRRVNPLRDEELRTYIALLAAAAGLIFAVLISADLAAGEEAVRHAVFQAVSIMTTTGYANADFAVWSPLALMILLSLMFVGGMALSTAGSMKVVRHLMLEKVLRRELDQTVHPSIVQPIRFNGRAVDEKTIRGLSFFILLYVALFVLGAIAILIESTRAGFDLTPFEAISASATTIGNVGPGFGVLGPMGSFEPFSDLSKAIMIVLMWMGRLELVPVAVLFTSRYWRQ
jgi:trk system potassium uptake protein